MPVGNAAYTRSSSLRARLSSSGVELLEVTREKSRCGRLRRCDSISGASRLIHFQRMLLKHPRQCCAKPRETSLPLKRSRLTHQGLPALASPFASLRSLNEHLFFCSTQWRNEQGYAKLHKGDVRGEHDDERALHFAGDHTGCNIRHVDAMRGPACLAQPKTTRAHGSVIT